VLFLKTFLPPLSPKEEKDYLEKMDQGDLEARYILIERNLRLVAHVCKKYQNGDEDMEDLISIGTIGLIKAIATFDHKKGNRLGTYAARCIDNELLMYLRSKKKTAREISLYEPIGTDKEGNQIHLLDIVESDEKDVVEAIELSGNMRRLYELIPKTLTRREQQIIKLRYGLYNQRPVTQREIADQIGISRSYVSRIEKRALEKLKREFAQA
jgi:RNA polymerase sporulation-specific sigma factor